MKLSYRKDIDGLRAIAVLAVILNHAKIPGFSGGYVGVDVFFVISGFLITSIIIREIEQGEFSFVKFYERRIRRILPALVSVSVFVLIASFILFDAGRLQAVGKSLMSAMLFYSNVNFWKETGYFDAPSQLKPFLHTWSLAVEEQFYIVYPLFMVIVSNRWKRSRNLVVCLILIASLGLSIYTARAEAAAAFYLTQFRIWELLAGGLLALNVFPTVNSKPLDNVLGAVGIALIALPIFLYTENTLFPGMAALPPVAGAVLVLYGGKTGETFVGRALGSKATVFFGKISYSLYLWHWPLIIFAKYYLIRPMTALEITAALAFTLAFSYLSWRYVETPFRSRAFLDTRRIYLLAACSATVIFMASGAVYYFDGFLASVGLTIESGEKKGQWEMTECNINLIDDPSEILTCRLGEKKQPAAFLVWGDSHARVLGKGINTAALNQGVAGALTYAQGCPPYLGIIPTPSHGDLPCDKYNEMVIDYLDKRPEINLVILVSRITLYLEGSPYKQEEGVIHILTDAQQEAPKNADSETLIRLGLDRTVQTLQSMGRRVVIIAPVPEIGYDVPSANYIASRTGRDANDIIAPTLKEYLTRSEGTRKILSDFENSYGLQVIEPWRLLCRENICRVAIDQVPLYLDDDHLSAFGSEYLAPLFEPVFASMKSAK